MDITTYLPYIVYKNLQEFIKYRQLETIEPFLSKEKFIKDIQFYRYIKINLKDSNVKIRKIPTKTYIFLTDIGSNYTLTSAQFDKLLFKIPNIKTPKKLTKNIDIIIISENGLTTHLIKKVHQYMKISEEKINIEHYSYNVFKIEIFKHNLVPKHRILDENEVKKVLTQLGINRNNLPKIKHKDDPPAIWLGCKPGDIVEITSTSEISLSRISYRVAI